MNELISIIVPIYKTEKFLEKCILSICNQTYKHLEIILIDDGSPDLSPQICDKYASIDERIKVVHKKNGGLSSARNCGLKIANGKYIFFLDSDDYLAFDTIEILYGMILSEHADISLCNLAYVDEAGYVLENILASKSPVKTEVLTGKECMRKVTEINGHFYAISCNKLYKKELFRDLYYEIGKIHEDEFIIHNILGKSKRVACTEKKLYFYTQRKESIMGKEKSIKNMDAIEAFLSRLHFLSRETDTDLQQAYKNMDRILWNTLFSFCEQFGYKDTALNKRMWQMKKKSSEVIPLLLKDNTRNIKERIALSILLLSPRVYYYMTKIKK